MSAATLGAAFLLGVSSVDVTVVALMLIAAACHGPVQRVRVLAWFFFLAVASIGTFLTEILSRTDAPEVASSTFFNSASARPLWLSIVQLVIALGLAVAAFATWFNAQRGIELLGPLGGVVGSAQAGPATPPTNGGSPTVNRLMRAQSGSGSAASPEISEIIKLLREQGYGSLRKLTDWLIGPPWVAPVVAIFWAFFIVFDPPFWALLITTSVASPVQSFLVWMVFSAGVSACSLPLAIVMRFGGRRAYDASVKYWRRHSAALIRGAGVVGLVCAAFLTADAVTHW